MPLNNVPLAGQTLAATQGPINQNFNVINTGFTVDHESFNLANQGKHNKVTLLQQAAPAVFVGTEVGLYNFPLAGTNELYVRKSDGTLVPCTNRGPGRPGWSYLPSGMIMAWGQSSTGATGFVTVTYASIVGFPGFTGVGVVNVSLTPYVASGVLAQAAGFVTLNNYVLSTTQFSASGPINTLFTWLVIGS